MLKDNQVQYDPQTDVLYLISKMGPVERSEEVSPGITIEYNDNGEVVGLEVLHASKIFSDKVIALLHAHQVGVL